MELVGMLNALMAGDYEVILAALADLYVLQDLSELPQTMMRIAETLIPSVFCTYNELHADTQSVIIAYRTEEWRKRMQPYVADSAPHLLEHPVYNHFLKTEGRAAVAISDFISEEEWRRTSFSAIMMKPLGLSDTLIFRFNSGSRAMIFIAINSATWGFSPRDKMVAMLLCSHFAVAYENAIAFTEAQALKLLADNSAAIGMIVVDSLGQLLHSNEIAIRLVGKYFNQTGWHNTLPDSIQTWLGTDASIGLPMSTLEEIQGATRLTIRWSDRRNGVKMLLLQEHGVATAGEMPSSGLTRREVEVLHWIGEGKRNTEIALILQISERTVEKHAGKIYDKLGVENRMGAALQVLSQRKIAASEGGMKLGEFSKGSVLSE